MKAIQQSVTIVRVLGIVGLLGCIVIGFTAPGGMMTLVQMVVLGLVGLAWAFVVATVLDGFATIVGYFERASKKQGK